MASQVRVRRTRKIRVEPSPAVKVASRLITEHMRGRLRRGVDRDMRPLFRGSRIYYEQLQAIGKGSTPTGTLTGGMVESIGLTRVKGPPLNPVMVFQADARQSEAVARPPWWIFLPTKTAEQRERLLAGWRSGARSSKPSTQRSLDVLVLYRHKGRARRGTEQARLSSLGISANRRPKHRTALKWLVGGYNKRMVRKMLGVTPTAQPEILRAIERAKVFTT